MLYLWCKEYERKGLFCIFFRLKRQMESDHSGDIWQHFPHLHLWWAVSWKAPKHWNLNYCKHLLGEVHSRLGLSERIFIAAQTLGLIRTKQRHFNGSCWVTFKLCYRHVFSPAFCLIPTPPFVNSTCSFMLYKPGALWSLWQPQMIRNRTTHQTATLFYR